MSILDMDDLSGVIDPEFLISNGYITVLTNCDYVKVINVSHKRYATYNIPSQRHNLYT